MNKNPNGLSLRTLGSCYLYGQGCLSDLEKALQYFERSAEFGDVTSMTFLASYGPADKRRDWLLKASALNDPVAMTILGEDLELGDLENSLGDSLTWYSKAAELGYAKAQNLVGFGNYNKGGHFLYCCFYFKKAIILKQLDGLSAALFKDSL